MAPLHLETEITYFSKQRAEFITIRNKLIFKFFRHGFRKSGYENCTRDGNLLRGEDVVLVDVLADIEFSWREAKMGSNMIVFEADSLFSDFGRFVIVGFFVDPPAVGLVFPVEISQVIAMLGTGQKAGDDKNEDDGRRDEPTSGNE